MGYPDDYPDRYKESIFAHHPDNETDVGSLVFLLTRAGGKLNVYVFQYLGSLDGRGDVVLPVDGGSVHDVHYDPSAEDTFLPEDMFWDNEKPRLSQPVRRWLDSRDYSVATRDDLLKIIAQKERFGLHSTVLE